MMTGVIVRAWKTVKPHVPMIKFRKGGTGGSGGATANTVQAASQPPSKGAPSAKGTSLPVIEDWQLPARYRRSTIDEREISMINSGGAF